MPPPSVSPPTPVVEMNPLGVASPKAMGGMVDLAPGTAAFDAHRVLAAGSTRMPFMRERSTTRPSSQVPRPGPLCPPPRTAKDELLVAGKVDGGDHISHIHAMRRSAQGACRIMPL